MRIENAIHFILLKFNVKLVQIDCLKYNIYFIVLLNNKFYFNILPKEFYFLTQNVILRKFSSVGMSLLQSQNHAVN